MKKLLLILLCLPMICAAIYDHQNSWNESIKKNYPNAQKFILRSEIIELSKNNSEIREKILISERQAENDTTGHYNFIRVLPFIGIEFWKKVKNKSITLDELNDWIRYYNNTEIFDDLAASKNYDLGDILIDELEDSFGKLFQPKLYIHQTEHLFGTKRTLRTFDEAKQEGTLHIYILRRVASKIIYAILILLAFILIKFIRKRIRKKANQVSTKEITQRDSNKKISYADELIKLNELKEKGIISEEEFTTQKKRILSNGK